MLSEDFNPPESARDPPHNWVEQKGKKRERERERDKNQDRTRTPERERELLKRIGTHTLGRHRTDWEISQDRGSSNSWRKSQQLD